MHKIIFHIGKKKVAAELPEKWAETTPKQLLDMLPVAATGRSDTANLKALRTCLGKKAIYLEGMDPMQVLSLCNCLSWIWEQPLTEADRLLRTERPALPAA